MKRPSSLRLSLVAWRPRRFSPAARDHGHRRLRRSAHRRSVHRRLHHEQRSRNRRQAGGAGLEGRPRQLQRHRRSTACRWSRRCPAIGTSACRKWAAGRPAVRSALFVDERANPAQRLALVAMANELSNGLVGTIVQVTPAPIQFTDHGSEIEVSAGQVALDVSKHMTHDPTCGAMQWFHPLASVDDATMGVAAAAPSPAPRSAPSGATRTSGRRSSARSPTERCRQVGRVRRVGQVGTPAHLASRLSTLRPARPAPLSPTAPVNLTDKVALITGGKRIGLVVAERAGGSAASTSRSATRARGPKRRRPRDACARRAGAAPRSRPISRSPTPARRSCNAVVDDVRPARHPHQHGVGVRATPVRRADAPPTGTRRSTSTCAPRFSARTRPRRTCGGRAAAASSTSATGWRAAAGRATTATCRTTSRRPASSR